MSHEPAKGPALEIDEALGALASDDKRMTVSARVHDAVLREWDQQQAVRTRRPARHRSSRGAWVAVPAAAAVILAAAVLQRESVRLPMREAVPTTSAAPVDVPAVSSGLPAGPVVEESNSNNVSAPAIAVSARSPVVIDGSVGYVIVPAPLVDQSALHVVRARMSRAALATLGMPIVDPNVDGLVEIEMLVGDDGVAQSIRHATLVSD